MTALQGRLTVKGRCAPMYECSHGARGRKMRGSAASRMRQACRPRGPCPFAFRHTPSLRHGARGTAAMRAHVPGAAGGLLMRRA